MQSNAASIHTSNNCRAPILTMAWRSLDLVGSDRLMYGDGTSAHATDAMLIPSYCLVEPCLPSTSRSVCQTFFAQLDRQVYMARTAAACIAGTMQTSYTDRLTGRQTDRQIDRQFGRHTTKQAGRQEIKVLTCTFSHCM